MRIEARMTTLCYIEKNDTYFMLHHVSKMHDVNKDRQTGVGGHFEHNESPEECLLREVREETGLTLTSWRFRRLIIFMADGRDTEYVCLYIADKYERRMISYNEGVLEWVEKEDVLGPNLREGDKIFFRLMNEDRPFFSLKLSYHSDCLMEAALDGQRVKLFDILDDHGERAGRMGERAMVHLNGDTHGTAHIWIVRERSRDGFDLPLQRRGRCKDSYPGCYDISSVGRVQAGDGFLPTVLRELKEELGVEASQEDLGFAGIHTDCMEEEFYDSMFKDSEYSCVYVYYRPVEVENLKLQEGEVESVVWMGLDECMEAVREVTLPNCLYVDELEPLKGYLKGHPQGGMQERS